MSLDSASTRNRLILIFIALLFAAGFYYTKNTGGAGLMVPHASAVWIVAVLAISIGIIILCRSRKIYLPHYWLGLAMLPLGFIISGFLAEVYRPLEWAFRIGFVTGGALFFFALFQYRPSRRTLESVLFFLVIASFLQSLIALAQIHQLYSLQHWIPITPGKMGGSFQQYIMLASFLATGLVTSLYLLTVPGFAARSRLYKAMLYVSITFTISFILASGSRVGLLGLLLGSLLLLLSRRRVLWKRKNRSIPMLIAIAIGIGYGFHLSDGLSRVEKTMQRDGYENHRYVIYELSWDLFTEKPLFGHGLGSFPRVFQEKRIPFQKEHPNARSSPGMYSHPHNEILFWLVEGGSVSVLGIIIASTVTLIQLIRIGLSRGLAYMGLILPITLHTMTELPFYLSPAPL